MVTGEARDTTGRTGAAEKESEAEASESCDAHNKHSRDRGQGVKEGALAQRGMPRWPGRYATVALEHASHAHPRAGGRGSPGSRLWLLTISTSCERGRISIWALGLEIAFSSLQCSDTSDTSGNLRCDAIFVDK